MRAELLLPYPRGASSSLLIPPPLAIRIRRGSSSRRTLLSWVTCLPGKWDHSCNTPYSLLMFDTCLFARSPAEMRDRRRFVRLLRRQQGSGIHLRMIAISTEEVAHDDRNVINCMLPPDCGDEPSISSVDIIKALELLVNPPDRRLSVEERNRVRRNIDTLRPATLKKGDEGLNWIMQLRSPRPITIAKDVKIFKWSSLEAALVKIMKKYVNFKFQIAVYSRY